MKHNRRRLGSALAAIGIAGVLALSGCSERSEATPIPTRPSR